MLQIIGCNNHLGEQAPGIARNLTRLFELNPALELIVVPEEQREPKRNDPRLRNLESVIATSETLAEVAQTQLEAERTPINILGDHAASMGTVAASSTQVETLGVIWIDAHADLNVETTTPSGNIHGMPVAALLGLMETPELNNLHFEGPKLKPENMVYIGLRDVDPGEKVLLEQHNIMHFYWDEVVANGLETCLEKIVERFQTVDKVHVSLDLDSMDPQLIPGVSVPVKGGLTPAQTHQILRTLIEQTPVCAVDIVEYNPQLDKDDITAQYVLDTLELLKAYF
ncbi:arginase [Gleimia sp. 6138-11-ORH1]|uniref:arginase n=1 Tax=Gleimia sp. 6138-11-ORH1 TaxID=2973937 RepID=UPI0021684C9D|nr:arginase [Gleimia sp. 6138-11-ORH1]MCS4484186.1 arginase [Gleimia sp. 6138-11-ORH1]